MDRKIKWNWQHRVHKTKKNKTKTQRIISLTPLYRNKTRPVVDVIMWVS